jgi:hypothetical protein
VAGGGAILGTGNAGVIECGRLPGSS